MRSAPDNLPPTDLSDLRAGIPPGLVAGIPRRRRNQICIIIIAVGLLNFLVYTLIYALLGGDAHNGYCKRVELPNGTTKSVYIIRGHYVHALEGRESEVSRGLWIYSYLHSITVPLTSGALIISMLVLARPHILATMRNSRLSGQTFVIAFGTIVVLASVGMALLFVGHFISQLSGV